MAQYIDKEILENILRRLWKENDGKNSEHRIYYNKALQDVQCEIDSLEIKEVDLKKELIEWHKEHFKKDGTFIGMSGFYLTNNSQMDIVKHFFELGLKVQKGE